MESLCYAVVQSWYLLWSCCWVAWFNCFSISRHTGCDKCLGLQCLFPPGREFRVGNFGLWASSTLWVSTPAITFDTRYSCYCFEPLTSASHSYMHCALRLAQLAWSSVECLVHSPVSHFCPCAGRTWEICILGTLQKNTGPKTNVTCIMMHEEK